MRAGAVTLSLCGDVMLGRGVDQILPHPGDPTLRERAVRDARDYVRLAETVNGPIPRPVDFAWPWGDSLRVLDEAGAEVRVVNLETAVTDRGRFSPGKQVHYRMSPANVGCLMAGRPDVCVLANNHVLDFGEAGLVDTLEVLSGSRLRTAGAGLSAAEARRAAAVPVQGGGRVLVVAFGTASSGVPRGWAAGGQRPGVAFLPALSPAVAGDITGRAGRVRKPGDLVVVSLHWGSNWGYDVSEEQVRFAHALVDGGIDVVYGHSSHHPRPVEVYRGRLILYGCGDVIDDYEGITGYEEFRSDLRLVHLVSLDPGTGRLMGLRMVPLQARRMRLQHASAEDADWLREVLERASRRFGTSFELSSAGMLVLRRRSSG